MVLIKKTEKRILLVEDNRFFCSLMKKYFIRYHGIETITCSTIAAAEDAVRSDSRLSIRIALLEVKMPDGDGIEFLQKMRIDRPDIESFLLTGCTLEQIESRIKKVEMPIRKVFFKGDLSIAEIVNAVVSRFQTS